MTKILFGFTVVAACVALLWAGIAGAQPGPPNPVPPGRVLAQCQANLDTCEASAFVPQTGQTQCYDGQTPDECPNGPFGQDGDIQAGVPFPNPRFTVNNPDGTVTDNLTGLIWLQDANSRFWRVHSGPTASCRCEAHWTLIPWRCPVTTSARYASRKPRPSGPEYRLMRSTPQVVDEG